MLSHLTQRWEYITSLYESGKLEEEGSSDAQEVLEDILVRNLTREYLEVLKVSFIDYHFKVFFVHFFGKKIYCVLL